MGKIISPNQSAFWEGHWIVENFILAQEIIDKIKRHKSNKGLMCIKIDLKKSFDRIEWDFIDRALETWGFSMEVRKLILIVFQQCNIRSYSMEEYLNLSTQAVA